MTLVLLDVVGTLLDVRGSVGARYAERAARHGVAAEAAALDRAFREAVRAVEPMAQRVAREGGGGRGWWREVVAATFAGAGAALPGPVADALFEDLYAWFGTPEPWLLHADVRPALAGWRAAGLRLGVLSNFDERLGPLLEALGLAALLDGVTTPAEARAAKPDPAIFHHALAQHGAAPEDAWYVGDDPAEDRDAARAAGLHTVLVDRRGQGLPGAVPDLLAARLT